MTPTPDPIAAIERALEGVTPGPWDVWREPTPTKDHAKKELLDQVDQTVEFVGAVYLLNAGGKCPAETGCGPTSAANAAAQSDYEQRIRSALFDVPAVESEPVGEAGGMPGSNGGFTMAAFRAVDVPIGTKLYASPVRSALAPAPAGEVELTKALMAAYEGFNRIACEGVTETRSLSDAFERCQSFANRGATSIRTALSRKPSDAQTVGYGSTSEASGTGGGE